ncbi:MAG TPA: hypothetical protein VK402_06405 [Blastococcus sp.]|nr:hypothetical protein [Blastococcus sp.]
MSHRSDPALLALHGVRILGFASSGQVAARYRLEPEEVDEHLLDDEARGRVRRSEFAGRSGWSITDLGRRANERQLAEELDALGARDVARQVHAAFLPLNRRLGTACTQWQIRPTPWDPMASNDHSDWRWDDRVLRTLASLGDGLDRACAPLAQVLDRFDGHVDRYRAALVRVDRGESSWVDAPDRASCHVVWIQLHEDLLATLGVERGTDDLP